MKTSQKVGLLGILLIAIGSLIAIILPAVGVYLGSGQALVATMFFAVGGVVFWVGDLWTWGVYLMEATQKWDEARRPSFCPMCW